MTYRFRRDMAEIVAPEPVDRVEVLTQLVGPLQPKLRPTLPANETLAEQTRKRIGSVHVVAKMTPIDQIVTVTRYRVGDDGDACGCGQC